MTLEHAASHLLSPQKCIQDQAVVWLYFEQRRNQREAILLPFTKWVGLRPAAGGGQRGGSTGSTAARGADGLARVRQTTEAQQQVAHRLAYQRGLSLVPYGGQT